MRYLNGKPGHHEVQIYLCDHPIHTTDCWHLTSRRHCVQTKAETLDQDGPCEETQEEQQHGTADVQAVPLRALGP
jgi:hypothetical protein